MASNKVKSLASSIPLLLRTSSCLSSSFLEFSSNHPGPLVHDSTLFSLSSSFVLFSADWCQLTPLHMDYSTVLPWKHWLCLIKSNFPPCASLYLWARTPGLKTQSHKSCYLHDHISHTLFSTFQGGYYIASLLCSVPYLLPITTLIQQSWEERQSEWNHLPHCINSP